MAPFSATTTPYHHHLCATTSPKEKLSDGFQFKVLTSTVVTVCSIFLKITKAPFSSRHPCLSFAVQGLLCLERAKNNVIVNSNQKVSPYDDHTQKEREREREKENSLQIPLTFKDGLTSPISCMANNCPPGERTRFPLQTTAI